MKRLSLILLGTLLFLLQGCLVAPILPMLASGVGGAASYSILNTANKTIPFTERETLRGAIQSLLKLGFLIKGANKTKTGWEIAAEAPQRKISVELERITEMATKITVNVMKGSIVKDKATAEAIILELEGYIQQIGKKEKTDKVSLLFVMATPPEATIRIMNIAQKFHQGIELKAGTYELEISAKDHETRAMSVKLKEKEERFIQVQLKKNTPPSNKFGF